MNILVINLTRFGDLLQSAAAIRALADGWTVVTKDHSLSAQWEHTVLVTETGYEILTVSDGMRSPPEWIK